MAGAAKEREVTELLEVMEACGEVKEEGEFQKVMSRIAGLFHSSRSVCAISDAGNLFATGEINNGLPQGYLQAYLAQQDSHLQPLVQRVMSGGPVTLLDLNEAHLDPKVQALNRKMEIDTCLTGVFRDPDKRTMVLCIPNPKVCAVERLLKRVRLLFPHLYQVMRTLSFPTGQVRPHPLSERELDVLRWVVSGKTNWEISIIMGVTVDTVKFHMKNIYRKLDASNKAQAIASAYRLKLVADPQS